MPIKRLSLSTTGTPLIPRSESSVASACTDVSGSTVITLVVMTSAACIGSSQLICSRIIYHVPRRFDTPQPRAAVVPLMTGTPVAMAVIQGCGDVDPQGEKRRYPRQGPRKEREKRNAPASGRYLSRSPRCPELPRAVPDARERDSNKRARREIVAEDLLPQLGKAIAKPRIGDEHGHRHHVG